MSLLGLPVALTPCFVLPSIWEQAHFQSDILSTCRVQGNTCLMSSLKEKLYDAPTRWQKVLNFSPALFPFLFVFFVSGSILEGLENLNRTQESLNTCPVLGMHDCHISRMNNTSRRGLLFPPYSGRLTRTNVKVVKPLRTCRRASANPLHFCLTFSSFPLRLPSERGFLHRSIFFK